MTKWKKAPDEYDFEDFELDDFESFFSETNDIDFENLFSDIQKMENNIFDSTLTGPPKTEDTIQISNQIPQQRIVDEKNNHSKSNQPLRINLEPRFMIGLTSNERSFKDDFYSIFLNNIKGKKIIPKEKVVMIHNYICKEAGVRKMRRDEYRVINNYFKNFAQFKDQILRCIIKYKKELENLIDLPSIIERANSIIEARKKRNKNKILH